MVCGSRRLTQALGRMDQLISIYLGKGCFLLHPSSMYDEFGPWIAHQPGLGVSGGAPDEVLGQLILLARAYSNNGTPSKILEVAFHSLWANSPVSLAGAHLTVTLRSWRK